MNLENAALLVREDIKTIGVKFNSNSQTYTYVLHDSLPTKLGDFVVVLTRDTIKVAEVVEIHDDVDIDPMNEITYKWVIANVSNEADKIEPEILATEKIVDALKKQQKRSVKDQVLAQFGVTSVAELLTLSN